MILFIFFSTILYARDLPEKEVTRRCNLEKVQVCVTENQTIIFQLESQEAITQQELQSKMSEKNELQTVIFPIVESIRLNEIQQIFLKKLTSVDVEGEENSRFGQIFPDGPLLIEHGKLPFAQIQERTTDKIRLQNMIEKEQTSLSQFRTILEKDSTLFSSKIHTIEQLIAEKKASLAQLQSLKHRHAVMCEFGCKSKFCPEN